MKRVILASRSPRRRELLALLIPEALITVIPPTSAQEIGFDGLTDWPSVESRLEEIARKKCDDVLKHLAEEQIEFDVLIAADTVIVGHNSAGELAVLGQPPDSEEWRAIVENWFRQYYFGRTHTAVTGLCVERPDGGRFEQIVKTEVTMAADREELLDWYLESQEPLGKAGGYAIQGAGSMFITAIKGSLSNVIGLPLESLSKILF